MIQGHMLDSKDLQAGASFWSRIDGSNSWPLYP